MPAGHTEVAKTILVITSLCHWHGSETFTGWRRVLRKEGDLLVVSQAAFSMSQDIFLVCNLLFDTSSGKYQGVYGVKDSNGAVSFLC